MILTLDVLRFAYELHSKWTEMKQKVAPVSEEPRLAEPAPDGVTTPGSENFEPSAASSPGRDVEQATA